MGKWMKSNRGDWVRNPYEHPNPWIRLMVQREPEIYWTYKAGYCLGSSAIEEATFHKCGVCGENDAWYRPTVGTVICHSCNAMELYDGEWAPPSGSRCTYEGASCPQPPNSCSRCEWMVHYGKKEA